jgi:hypothetical protein
MRSGPIEYTLSRPVTSVDQECKTLTLREPTGLDMRTCGDQADPAFTHRLIARLANITPAAVDAMAARDVVALGRIINRNFLETPDQTTSSIGITNAPDGGGVPSGTSLN